MLPGGADTLFVALFWRSSDPDSWAFRNRCDALQWPDCFEPVAVDLDTDDGLDDWFGQPTGPMLAVVTDGAMLCMEFDATPRSCRALIACGVAQYSMMQSMSA